MKKHLNALFLCSTTLLSGMEGYYSEDEVEQALEQSEEGPGIWIIVENNTTKDLDVHELPFEEPDSEEQWRGTLSPDTIIEFFTKMMRGQIRIKEGKVRLARLNYFQDGPMFKAVLSVGAEKTTKQMDTVRERMKEDTGGDVIEGVYTIAIALKGKNLNESKIKELHVR